jgi:hypothetical protein
MTKEIEEIMNLEWLDEKIFLESTLDCWCNPKNMKKEIEEIMNEEWLDEKIFLEWLVN